MTDATKQILTELKKICPSAKLPSGITFEMDQETLYLTVLNPIMNMQSDGAAFEGWATLIKSQVPKIQKVELNVSSDELPLYRGDLHFNRFLWRALNFALMFDWFELGNISQAADDFMKNEFCDVKINQPGKSRQEPQKSTGETYVEWLFANAYKEELCGAIGCNTLVNQFPVGLFKGTVSKANQLFNGSKSAIDILGIQYPDILHLVELKIAGNEKMGGISEFLFYAFVLRGLFGKQKIIALENDYVVEEFKAFNNFKANQIKGHLLAEKYHPLLTKEVLALLNTGLNPLNISLDALSYHRDQDIISKPIRVMI